MALVYRSAAITAAQIAGEDSAMDVAADGVASRARSFAAGHGGLMADIGTERTPGKRGVTDRIAYLDHAWAAAIEFGHLTRPGEHAHRQWVEGLHIMRRAM
jgi:hypothetical protein